MNIHKEEVNNELTGTKNVKREVNPFMRIGYSMYQVLKHFKKGAFHPHRIFPISSILRRALLHFNISGI